MRTWQHAAAAAGEQHFHIACFCPEQFKTSAAHLLHGHGPDLIWAHDPGRAIWCQRQLLQPLHQGHRHCRDGAAEEASAQQPHQMVLVAVAWQARCRYEHRWALRSLLAGSTWPSVCTPTTWRDSLMAIHNHAGCWPLALTHAPACAALHVLPACWAGSAGPVTACTRASYPHGARELWLRAGPPLASQEGLVACPQVCDGEHDGLPLRVKVQGKCWAALLPLHGWDASRLAF